MEDDLEDTEALKHQFLTSFEQELQEWLLSNRSNGHFYSRPINTFYVRRGIRAFRSESLNQHCECFTIANVDFGIRGQGFFADCLKIVEREVFARDEFGGIFIENILQDRFRRFFMRLGYRKLQIPIFCMVKLKESM